jgi:hypothetical protein
MTFALRARLSQTERRFRALCARDGDNLSPFLQWEDPPDGTQSYALVVEDLDTPRTAEPSHVASPFRHWAVFDIPPRHRHLAKGRSSKGATEALPQGTNDFGTRDMTGRTQSPAIRRTRIVSGFSRSMCRRSVWSGRRRPSGCWMRRAPMSSRSAKRSSRERIGLARSSAGHWSRRPACPIG